MHFLVAKDMCKAGAGDSEIGDPEISGWPAQALHMSSGATFISAENDLMKPGGRNVALTLVVPCSFEYDIATYVILILTVSI